MPHKESNLPNIDTLEGRFRGYAPPTSSTTYTPNQFFDVVLPNSSRGCVRLVAYLIRKTLGWSDEFGDPLSETTYVSYRELNEKARVSRAAIKEAISEAIDKRYIECLKSGQPHRSGEEGHAAQYKLRWDSSGKYCTSPSDFDGFYAGNGNLTHIPNAFFDFTIPTESLSVSRVIGAVIRHTIGFREGSGCRRLQVQMSFREIMRRTGIASSSTVDLALKSALASGHLRKVTDGMFDPKGGLSSSASTFAVQWSDAEEGGIASKGTEIEAAKRFSNRSEKAASVQKSKRCIGSEIEVADGSKTEAGSVQKPKRQAFKNRSDIETTPLNNISKQQQKESVAVVQCLVNEGVSLEKSIELSQRFDAREISRQRELLSKRTISKNRAGFLVAAIERSLPAPDVRTSEHRGPHRDLLGGSTFVTAVVSEAQQRAEYQKRMEARYQAFRLSKAKTIDRCFKGFPIPTGQPRRQKRPQTEVGILHQFSSFGGSKDQTIQELSDQFDKFIRRRLENCKKISERAYRQVTTDLDDPNGRAQLILEFIERKNPSLIPDFWTWDRTVNDQPFSLERKAL